MTAFSSANSLTSFLFLFSAALLLLLPACQKEEDEKPRPEPLLEKEAELQEDQWYLTGQGGRQTLGLSRTEYKGRGVLIAIIDDGLEMTHEDLKDNIAPGSFDYFPDLYPLEEGAHGTACAGIIAGTEANGLGIRGIAPAARLIAFNPLQTELELGANDITDALVREAERVWVSNNSWAPRSSDGAPYGSPFEVEAYEAAFRQGVETGRNGKGIIYVFSSGNVKNVYANVTTNTAVMTNNRYTIPVGAVDDRGMHSDYSVDGATLLVCAPSNGNGRPGITTTDRAGEAGYNPQEGQEDYANQNYTRHFGGTSAATAMVSGVVALMLEANPELGWRDVRMILAKSTVRNDPSHSGWERNGAGLWFNPLYGFGVVDADAAIAMAESWQNLEADRTISGEAQVDQIIPDNDSQGIVSTITLEGDMSIEFVDIYVDIDHNSTVDLDIELRSPSGTKSRLLLPGADNNVNLLYRDWRYGTVRCLDENPAGEWQLTVRDPVVGTSPGLFKSWRLVVHGR